ncbi:hypothetical protein BC835DRAFT_1364816 [Cytidiella melzeri]|nr:hypothetical protein BC835DRAFT_1364816 [Cytidiella melzeri]
MSLLGLGEEVWCMVWLYSSTHSHFMIHTHSHVFTYTERTWLDFIFLRLMSSVMLYTTTRSFFSPSSSPPSLLLFSLFFFLFLYSHIAGGSHVYSALYSVVVCANRETMLSVFCWSWE